MEKFVVGIAPPTCRSPAPVNTTALVAPLLTLMMLPEMVAVPVLMPSRAVLLLELVVLRVRLPAFKVPAPTLSCVVPEFELAVTVTAPLTFKTDPELMITLLVGGVELPGETLNAAMDGVTVSTVRTNVPLTVTVSPACGVVPPQVVHVPADLEFP